MGWPDYVKKCREIAFDVLELRPHDFYDLTPREFEDMCKGYAKRERRDWEKLAWVSANIMNVSPWLKQRITVKQLLGPDFTATEEMGKTEDIKEEMARIAEYNKRKFWTKLSDKYAKKGE